MVGSLYAFLSHRARYMAYAFLKRVGVNSYAISSRDVNIISECTKWCISPLKEYMSYDKAIECVNANHILCNIEKKTVSSDKVRLLYVEPYHLPDAWQVYETLMFLSKLWEDCPPITVSLSKKQFYFDYYDFLSRICSKISLLSSDYIDKDTLLYKALRYLYSAPGYKFENRVLFGISYDPAASFGFVSKDRAVSKFYYAIYSVSRMLIKLYKTPYDYIQMCYTMLDKCREYVLRYNAYNILFGIPAYYPVNDEVIGFAIVPTVLTIMDFDADIVDAFKTFSKYATVYSKIASVPSVLYDYYKQAVQNIQSGIELDIQQLDMIARRICNLLKAHMLEWRW